MAHLSLSQTFLVLVPKLAVSLQPTSPLSPPLSPLPQHLVDLQPAIILALKHAYIRPYIHIHTKPVTMRHDVVYERDESKCHDSSEIK